MATDASSLQLQQESIVRIWWPVQVDPECGTSHLYGWIRKSRSDTATSLIMTDVIVAGALLNDTDRWDGLQSGGTIRTSFDDSTINNDAESSQTSFGFLGTSTHLSIASAQDPKHAQLTNNLRREPSNRRSGMSVIAGERERGRRGERGVASAPLEGEAAVQREAGIARQSGRELKEAAACDGSGAGVCGGGDVTTSRVTMEWQGQGQILNDSDSDFRCCTCTCSGECVMNCRGREEREREGGDSTRCGLELF